MSVLLPVDEAFALDYLAILYTKHENAMDVIEEVKSVEAHLSEQIPNLCLVLSSPEFLALCRANQDTFRAVSASGVTPVQEANYSRFKAKQALQARFWPFKPMAEKKRPQGV